MECKEHCFVFRNLFLNFELFLEEHSHSCNLPKCKQKLCKQIPVRLVVGMLTTKFQQNEHTLGYVTMGMVSGLLHSMIQFLSLCLWYCQHFSHFLFLVFFCLFFFQVVHYQFQQACKRGLHPAACPGASWDRKPLGQNDRQL